MEDAAEVVGEEQEEVSQQLRNLIRFIWGGLEDFGFERGYSIL